MTVQILDTTSGLASATVLGSVTVTDSQIPTTTVTTSLSSTTITGVFVDFSSLNITITVGQKLAFRCLATPAFSPSRFYVLQHEANPVNRYTPGSQFFGTTELSNSRDVPFKVFVLPDPDTDNDGLTDSEEAALGTDPNDPDSDDDGLLDGTEVDIAVNGCPSPLDADSDDDTLSDGVEVANGTDPCSVDTDGDTIPDAIDPAPTSSGSSTGCWNRRPWPWPTT